MNNTHDSLNSKIANRYGVVWQNKVKQFARLRSKRVKLECGLRFIVQCRNNHVVPKFARIKPVKCFMDYESFFHTANQKLLRRVIRDYHCKITQINNTLYELHLQLTGILDQDLWDAVDTMTYNRSNNIRRSSEYVHNKKLEYLTADSRTKANKQHHLCDYPRCTTQSDAAVINLSSVTLNENGLNALGKGLNFALTPRNIPMESIVCSIEDAIFRNKIPTRDAECLRQDIATFLRRAKLPPSNMSRSDRAALMEIRNNEDILILPADKGNATVIVDTDAYENKINHLLSDTTTYKKLNHNPTTRNTNKIIKLLQSINDKNLLTKLRPCNPTSPKIYGLPKIHKPDWPLRPIVSQIDSPTYMASKHLATLLKPFTGNTSSFVKDSKHFVRIIKNEIISDSEIMVSFDVESLFTNVPVEEVISLIKGFITDSKLPSAYLDLSEFCLKSGYFMWRGDYYSQIDGVAMGSPIAPVVANIFMEWVERELVDKMTYRPRFWLRYVDDVFAIVNRDDLAIIFQCLNSLHEKVHFTKEEEKEGGLPFLDVMVIRGSGGELHTTVYRKPTHTNRYLHASSHHHPSQISSVPRSLINRALSLCDPPYIECELRVVRQALENNGYSWRQSSRWAQTTTRRKPSCVNRSPVYLTYVKGVTDKISHYLQRRFDIVTRFRPPALVKSILRSPKDRDPLNVPGVYKIHRHPNFNRDHGWLLPTAWKPLFLSMSHTTNLEQDSISSVCLQEDESNEDDINEPS
ncbi:uncharacterized protein LOC112042946 isoform X2 [Bicyclus anynana]|nr:uncharacterized protein LOC112042946 isoform X2 [Bicyclus anynana]